MSIRARILLWLGAFLLVALVVLTGLLYGELVELKEGVLEGGTTPEPAWQETGEMALFYGVPTVVTLLVGRWWLLRKLLAPITSLTQAAERIHATSLKERLPPTGRGDELDRLTEVFNSMTTRLDESFTLMRDFTPTPPTNSRRRSPFCGAKSRPGSAPPTPPPQNLISSGSNSTRSADSRESWTPSRFFRKRTQAT